MTQLEKMLQPDSQYVFYDDQHGFCINTDDVLMLIEPERKGEWILGEDMPDYPRVPYKYGRLYCSNCGNLAYFDRNLELPFFDYCPICGADMRGESNG